VLLDTQATTMGKLVKLILAMSTTLLTLPTETWLMQTHLIPQTAQIFQKNGIVSKELQEQDCQLNVHQ